MPQAFSIDGAAQVLRPLADGLPCVRRDRAQGFVDCHMHLPFAGWRADEHAMKVVDA